MNGTTCISKGAFLTAAMMALTALPAGAAEYKMTMGSSHPPVLPWTIPLKTLIVPDSNKILRQAGIADRIVWTEAYGGSLYNFQNTLEGVGDGLADIGWVGSLWEPAKQPLQNIAYYMPFVTGDFRIMAKLQDRLIETVPAFAAEWTKHNTVYLGAEVADTYHLVTKFPVTKFSDLKGKKLIAPGAIAARLQGTGAIAVDAGLPLFYNMLQTGVADGTLILITGVLPFKLHEVAPYITKVDTGAVFAGALAMNKDTWNKLPPHMKVLFKGLGREYAEMTNSIVAQREAAAWAALEKNPKVTISELPMAERVKWANALPDAGADWVKRNGEAGRQVLKVFMDAARKSGAKPLRDWDKGL